MWLVKELTRLSTSLEPGAVLWTLTVGAQQGWVIAVLWMRHPKEKLLLLFILLFVFHTF